MPSSFRDEYRVRRHPLESQAQVIHLLCLNWDRTRAPETYEAHIDEICARLERLIKNPPNMLVEK